MFAVFLGLLSISMAHAQLFVANLSGTVGEFTTSGAVVNASLISGAAVHAATGIAISGSDLFVSNHSSGTIGEYTTSGAVVNASLISGLSGPDDIVISGSDLFVTNQGTGTVGEYTTSGAVVNASLISGINGASGIAVSGSNIFVSNDATGTIREYTTSGVLVNASLISGLNDPIGITISGSDLFVANGGGVDGQGTVGEYTTSGAVVNASLITGLTNPSDVAVSGSDLFVSGEGNFVIGEYTTSGAVVNASLITDVSDPEQIAIETPGAPQRINFPAIATQPYPGSAITLSATASSGLPVSFSLVSGPATLSNGILTLTGTGTVSVQASQPGDTDYAAATSVTQSFTVTAPVSFNGNPTATPENDGVPNLLKYFYDIDSTQPMTPDDRAALPSAGATTIAGAPYLTLTYRQFALQTGIVLTVQTSNDLRTWTNVSNPTIIQIGADSNTGDPIMQVQVPATGTSEFIRLAVTQP